MQYPTCTNIRIRSVHDVHKIFYAIQQGLLQLVTRRLGADERSQLCTGCVYVWQERGPHTEFPGIGIERFTEGRRWSPSRVRDEFLFYYERFSPSPDCANQQPPRGWDPLVKQTYSIWVETGKGRRKWHLTAYFTQATVDQLGSIDDMRGVKDLVVPEDMFRIARVTKTRSKNDDNRTAESSKSSNSSAAGASRYAPFPTPTLPDQPESSGQILMFQPYANHDASASHHQQPQNDLEAPLAKHFSATPSMKSTSSFRSLNQYQTATYRPLLPSSHLRSAPDHPYPDYTSTHQQLPVRFASDVQHPSTSLPQVQQEPERGATLLSMSVPLASTSHCSVDIMQSYTPPQLFPTQTASQWNSVSSATLGPHDSSVYFEDDIGSLAASAAMQSSSSYPPAHDEITANTDLEPYQIMAPYLNLLHGDLSGSSSVAREPLPSLSILHEPFSYDFSMAMVAPSDVSAPSGSLNDAVSYKASASSSSSSQMSKVLWPGLNKSGGPSRDLDLAPLNTLARLQPYRREPMDDRALRRLWPRSP